MVKRVSVVLMRDKVPTQDSKTAFLSSSMERPVISSGSGTWSNMLFFFTCRRILCTWMGIKNAGATHSSWGSHMDAILNALAYSHRETHGSLWQRAEGMNCSLNSRASTGEFSLVRLLQCLRFPMAVEPVSCCR